MRLIEKPFIQENNPNIAGCLASDKVRFGGYGRYALYAVHTRFDKVQWFVADAELIDELTGFASIIRQADTIEDAMFGL